MSKLCSKKGQIIIFCIVLLLMVANVFYWGMKKEGFYCDELYSYHFVCQTDFPFIIEDRGEETWMNSWHSSEFFQDYLTITEEEAFDIWGTYKSIERDTHPPLFYILMEIICSAFSLVFPGAFSKWCGIAINIIFFVPTILILYKLANNIMESRIYAIVTCILYGFSIGAVSTVVYIRMYMMLTLFGIIFAYINVLLWKRLWNERSGSAAGLYIALFLTTVLGIMSQYYFLIYAFFICAVIWLCALAAKKYKFMLKYTAVMALGILVSYLIWPELRYDLLAGDTAESSLASFSGSMDWSSFQEYLAMINAELFSGLGGLLLILAALIIIYALISIWWNVDHHITQKGGIQIWGERKETVKKIEFQIGSTDIIIIQISLAVFGYLFLIAKIAPFKEDRYIFNIFPLIILVLVYIAKRLLSGLKDSRRPGMIALFAMLALIAVGYISPGVRYLYEGTNKKFAVADMYSNLPAFYIHSGSSYRACGDSVYFSKALATYPVGVDGINHLSEALEQLEGVEIPQILIYVDSNIPNSDAVLEQIKQELGANELRLLFPTEYGAAYITER